jgi:hypothetical protein
LLLSEIPKDEISNYYVISWDYSNIQRMNFVDEFVRNNKTFFIASSINTCPYKHFANLEEDMIYTMNSSWEGTDKILKELFDREVLNPWKSSYFYRDLGIYIKSDGKISRLMKLRSDARTMEWIDTWAKHFNKNNETFTKNLLEVTQNYNEEKVVHGKELAYDYFWQSREDIRLIYEQFETIFFTRNDERSTIWKSLKKMIIKEYANNEKEIKKMIANKWIRFYIITDFYKKYKTEIDKSLNWSTPYGKLKSAEKFIENTKNYRWDPEFISLKKAQIICEYISNDWKKYNIWLTEINWKTYMVAEPYWNSDMYYALNYRSITLSEEILKTLSKI